MFGRREPSGEEIARRVHELYLQRGGEQPKAERSFRFGGGGPVRLFTYPAKGQLDGETRVPMVTKIISFTVDASETLMPDTIDAGTRLIEEGTLFTKIWAIRKRALDLFFLHGW
jgi:hypothetical protein